MHAVRSCEELRRIISRLGGMTSPFRIFLSRHGLFLFFFRVLTKQQLIVFELFPPATSTEISCLSSCTCRLSPDVSPCTDRMAQDCPSYLQASPSIARPSPCQPVLIGKLVSSKGIVSCFRSLNPCQSSLLLMERTRSYIPLRTRPNPLHILVKNSFSNLIPPTKTHILSSH